MAAAVERLARRVEAESAARRRGEERIQEDLREVLTVQREMMRRLAELAGSPNGRAGGAQYKTAAAPPPLEVA
jgi:hypothetical protein